MGDVSPRSYYDRQMRIPGWGPEGQAVLGRSTVLVVGVGGLGCPVLAALARAGVGRLVFADPDRVEASNLPRQTLFNPDDVGCLKVEAAAKALNRSNPWVQLEPCPFKVDRSNVRSLVENADLVVDGSDNFATKFLVHDACRSAGKPLVIGSLYQWEAQLTVFPFHRGDPGCWRCLYPRAPEDGCVGVCADVGVAGALASLAGNAQALAAIRLLLDLPGAPALATWVFDPADWTPRLVRWKPAGACACHLGPGDWSWLDVPEVFPRRETVWSDVAIDDRQVVLDVREPREVQPGEWEWFENQGSQVGHRPWSQWATQPFVWDPQVTYLIVCAKGHRSLAALKTVPPGIRALSLAGGTEGLGMGTLIHVKEVRPNG